MGCCNPDYRKIVDEEEQRVLKGNENTTRLFKLIVIIIIFCATWVIVN